MATINNYTEINSWKSALILFGELNSLFKSNIELTKEWEIRSQVIRASLSIMNNIAEGFGRKTNKEFIRFLSISRGSCYEVESMIHALQHTQKISRDEAEHFFSLITDIRKNLAGLSKYLHSTL